MVIQERVATRSVLVSKNIVLNDQSCPLCLQHQEKLNHLFLHCMANWWFDTSYRNLEKHIWEAYFYATIWSIWIMRNKLIFQNVTIGSEEVVDLIKYRVAMWMKVKFEIKVYSIEGFKGFLDGIRLLKL
ncbi:hypothetical protein RHMOL_Rhmol10G0155600 [Rhododendron molle]|uniref:Uncharacterized protein n=1 Tax=Rhododendron molle TaxID=49168 RepID=A0ACC0M3Q4_RHOML|nr:hypothetical protein RHMOL_Rhmol10G0155600 [Rhododendron molle]